MATPRSVEDHLRRLTNIHLHGGRPAFVTLLADIRVSRIYRQYLDLYRAVTKDARGLRMESDPDVRATVRHIARQRRLMRRMNVSVASGNGHAMMV